MQLIVLSIIKYGGSIYMDIKNQAKIRGVFRPNTPMTDKRVFVNRSQLIEKVIEGILNIGQHAILFGERGVGKTSLVSILDDLFTDVDNRLLFSRTNCDTETDFSSLWRRILRNIKIPHETRKKIMGLQGGYDKNIQHFSLDQLLPEREISPDDIRVIFQGIPIGIIIILDEVDRIADATVRRLLADTIKALSDHSLITTLILVGVADTVDSLIGEHASIERALIQVHVPRMSRGELSQILVMCLTELDMQINNEARNSILVLSKGLPHYTHQLGMYATLSAMNSNRTLIIHNDVEYAVDRAITDSSQSIKRRYFTATPRARNSLYPDVLLACALADTNGLGFFDATEVKYHLSELKGKAYEVRAFSKHLTQLSDNKHEILERVGEARNYQYRFINPLMQPFVLMKGIQDEKIDYEKLQKMMGISE